MGILGFIIGIIVSTIIIYLITKLFGEREGIKTAFFAAIIGSVVFIVVHFALGNGLIAAAVGGIAWLLALKWLYNMKWLRTIIVAVIIWIVATIIGAVLPTAGGPL
jgi:uncharacterized membrane protein